MSLPPTPKQNIVIKKATYDAALTASFPVYVQQMVQAHYGELEAKLNEMKEETQATAEKLMKAGTDPSSYVEAQKKQHMEYIKSQQVPFEEIAMRALVEADDFAIKACSILEQRHLQNGVIISDLAVVSR